MSLSAKALVDKLYMIKGDSQDDCLSDEFSENSLNESIQGSFV